MWTKVAFVLISVAIVIPQIAVALKCFSCNSPEWCLNPSIQECNEETDRKTMAWMTPKGFQFQLAKDELNSYKCVNLALPHDTDTDQTKHSILGCMQKQTELIPNSFEQYKTCDSNLCNAAGGTYSRTKYTLTTAALIWLLAKLAFSEQ